MLIFIHDGCSFGILVVLKRTMIVFSTLRFTVTSKFVHSLFLDSNYTFCKCWCKVLEICILDNCYVLRV